MERAQISALSQHLTQCALMMVSQNSVPAPENRALGPGPRTGVRTVGLASPLLRSRQSSSRAGRTGLAFTVQHPPRQSVSRRNERERDRVRQVNAGFQTLRQHVPRGAANKTLSKVETLRSAVEYIRALQQILEQDEAFQSDRARSPSLTVCCALSARSASPSSLSSSSTEGGGRCAETELIDFSSWFVM